MSGKLQEYTIVSPYERVWYFRQVRHYFTRQNMDHLKKMGRQTPLPGPRSAGRRPAGGGARARTAGVAPLLPAHLRAGLRAAAQPERGRPDGVRRARAGREMRTRRAGNPCTSRLTRTPRY